MKCFLFEHKVIEERHCLVSAETNVLFPNGNYWKYVGMIDLENIGMELLLKRNNEPMEISMDVFDSEPSVNKLV